MKMTKSDTTIEYNCNVTINHTLSVNVGDTVARLFTHEEGASVLVGEVTEILTEDDDVHVKDDEHGLTRVSTSNIVAVRE